MVTGRVILSGGQSFPFTASARPAPRGGAYTSQLTAVAICEKNHRYSFTDIIMPMSL